MHCFVTVGTTQFIGLTHAILTKEFLNTLNSMKYKTITVQCGTGCIPEYFKEKINEKTNTKCWYHESNGIFICFTRYFDRLDEEIKKADLIIGHAGAGTCLEVLSYEKPLIVVVNNELANNHQLELAEKLAEDDLLLYTTPKDIVLTLKNPKLYQLKKFPKVDSKIFANFLCDYLSIKG